MCPAYQSHKTFFLEAQKSISSTNGSFLSADESFQQEFLKTHNTYREKHRAPPMTLNNELSASAQKWADYLLSKRTLEHSSTDDGENIYNMNSSATLKLTG